MSSGVAIPKPSETLFTISIFSSFLFGSEVKSVLSNVITLSLNLTSKSLTTNIFLGYDNVSIPLKLNAL